MHAVTHWLLSTVAWVRPCTGQFSPVGSDFPHIAIYLGIALYFTILHKPYISMKFHLKYPPFLDTLGVGSLVWQYAVLFNYQSTNIKIIPDFFQVFNTKPIFSLFQVPCFVFAVFSLHSYNTTYKYKVKQIHICFTRVLKTLKFQRFLEYYIR